ncbi:MAG TPA: hypothetical protein VGX72_04055 [Solirubrobacteraceae bacterium]|jgi:hypothetical protein|nr:hypothetical protein [Solirubrobacteraceae bacterium]
MHDLDRIQLEAGEYEYGELGGEYEGELEGEGSSAIGPDNRELELASELLEVGSEQELEQFLGDLISSATSALGRFADSPTGRAVGGILKDAASRALPVLGQAVGDYVSPGSGGEWGRQAGAAASQLFGLELEGLSSEDKEFELARRYVQWARSAARTAARAAARVQAPPRTIARTAAAHAARMYAPGLLGLIEPTGYAPAVGLAGARAHAPLTGRWVRRGRYVVVHL